MLAAAPPVSRAQQSQADPDMLWEAARQGDVARIRQALDKGVDVNAKARYGVTALYWRRIATPPELAR